MALLTAMCGEKKYEVTKMSSLIVKEEEKIDVVFELLGDDSNEEELISQFKELYPKDWAKVQMEYLKEECETKPGQLYLLSHPNVYLKYMNKVTIAKRQIKE